MSFILYIFSFRDIYGILYKYLVSFLLFSFLQNNFTIISLFTSVLFFLFSLSFLLYPFIFVRKLSLLCNYLILFLRCRMKLDRFRCRCCYWWRHLNLVARPQSDGTHIFHILHSLGRKFVRILGLSLVQLSSHLPHLICQTLNGGSCLLLKLHILDGHLPH